MNCLDAETLAAWFDGGLKGAALEDVRAHVAGCERCQMLLGAMAGTRAALPPSLHERAPRRWLAWAVPLTATAMAIAVWVAIPEQRNVPVVTPAAAPVQTKEAAEPPPAREPAAARAPEAARPAAPVPSPAERRANVGAIAGSPVAQSATAETSQALPAAPPPPPSAPSLAAPPAAGASAAPEAASDALARREERITIAAARPLVASIESLCGGGWTVAPPDVAGGMTAGSAPSPQVCWVVGRGGTIRRSTNRQTWERIPFPDNTDLTAVRATDAQTASVSTADGRTFRTSDGGISWIQE